GAPPLSWGDEPAAGALLREAGLTVGNASRESIMLDFEARAAAVAFLVATAGHVVAERPRLAAEGRWPQLLGALAALVAERDEGRDGRVALRCDYLIVSATASAPTPARA
ncbi:MAG: Methyltransferase type 11, partial [Conexibacter sp.]|nr:Methyltransferase type 11 [Conexibacter sp.]